MSIAETTEGSGTLVCRAILEWVKLMN